MSDLKEGLDRDRYYKNNPVEGQKDVLPEFPLIEPTETDERTAQITIAKEYGYDAEDGWQKLADSCVDHNRATDILMDLAGTEASLQTHRREFRAHIRSTREEMKSKTELLTESIRQFNELLSQHQQDVEKLAAMTEDRNLWRDEHNEDCPNLRLLQTAEEKMKRAVEVLKQDSRCLSQKQVDAAIKILSPDTESDNKDITK